MITSLAGYQRTASHERVRNKHEGWRLDYVMMPKVIFN